MAAIDGKRFDRKASSSADGLTRVMILHPIACGLAFIAFLLALGAGVFGSLLSAMVAGLAWILTLIVMAVDFSLFGVCSMSDVGEVKLNYPVRHQIIKNHVNKDGSGSRAYYSTGMWTILAAMILLFLGTLIVLFTCFSARKKTRATKTHADTGYDNGYSGTPTRTTRRKRFGFI